MIVEAVPRGTRDSRATAPASHGRVLCPPAGVFDCEGVGLSGPLAAHAVLRRVAKLLQPVGATAVASSGACLATAVDNFDHTNVCWIARSASQSCSRATVHWSIIGTHSTIILII